MASYILGIDQGTTSSRALLIDHELTIVASAQEEFAQHFPKPGWVEHDPEEIWRSVVHCIQKVSQEKSITAIGITNQRETTLIWDKKTGQPIYNAIVWQCRRTGDQCDQLKADGYSDLIHQKTGLVIDPYFSATKIAWILDHVPGARKRAERGELAFGTIDTFLAWRLSGGKAHVTDLSNASRTLLMNIHTLEWDADLCELFQVPRSILPKILSNSEVVASTEGISALADGIPIASLVGDQQAALFGQCAFEAGQAKCTYGTGSFLLMNTGGQPFFSKKGLLTTVAWQREGQTTYALEGSSFIAGAAVQWLRDGLGIIQSSDEVEALAGTVSDNGGVTFIPALAGLGAPHWNDQARGMMAGLSRATTRGHIARATLEGIAFQQYGILQAMQEESGIRLAQLKVDGGAARNNLMMQFQADILDVPVVRPKILELTVIGAAMLAGLTVGYWASIEDISDQKAVERIFEPRLLPPERKEYLRRWEAALSKLIDI